MIKQKIYETIVKNLPLGFTTVDEYGITVDFNHAAEIITGFTKDEVIGKPHNDIFHPASGKEICPLFRHAFVEKAPAMAKEKTFIKKSGETITLLVSVAPLYDSDGKFIGGVEIFRDITEIKRLERERKNILAMFAHDIKNSINTSIGFATRLLSGKVENQNEYLKIIMNELKTVESLIIDFLEFSRLETKESMPQIKEFDLYELIKREIENIILKANEKNISIIFIPDENAPFLKIQADENMIKRVISNLLDNAIKYTHPFGKVSIKTTNTNEEVLVQVEDNGIGIAKDKLQYIFDAFYRISSESKGSGLGLSIAKKIVESHGGRIWAESTPNKGSIFSFTLPRK